MFSGAAAFAALYHNKVAAATPGSKVVVVITGGNISPEELVNLQRYTKQSDRRAHMAKDILDWNY